MLKTLVAAFVIACTPIVAAAQDKDWAEKKLRELIAESMLTCTKSRFRKS
jgi:hypothetical protein